MQCIPPCKRCKTAGACDGTQAPAPVLPEPRRNPHRAVKPTAPRPGERKTYLVLSCGHYTDSAAIMFYSVWQPRPDEGPPMFWCETCHDWKSPELRTATGPSPLF